MEKTIQNIRHFIDEEFKKIVKENGRDYDKLMERVLQAKFTIYDFLSKKISFKEEVISREHDSVNHPSHYTRHPSGVECIEITRHYCFSIGNAIKYLWRAGLKRDAALEDKQKEIEDLKKAVWYINDRIKQLEDEK